MWVREYKGLLGIVFGGFWWILGLSVVYAEVASINLEKYTLPKVKLNTGAYMPLTGTLQLHSHSVFLSNHS